MTDKERLEEIKDRVLIDKVYYEFNDSKGRWGKTYTLSDEDYEYLIQQAERVQKLERELEEHKSKFTVEYTMSLRKRNKRYREALEFYAGEETYEPSEVQVGAVTKEGYKILKYKYDPIINTDKGKKARKALEESE